MNIVLDYGEQKAIAYCLRYAREMEAAADPDAVEYARREFTRWYGSLSADVKALFEFHAGKPGSRE